LEVHGEKQNWTFIKKIHNKTKHSILYPLKGLNKELSHYPISHPSLLALKRKLSTLRAGGRNILVCPYHPQNRLGIKKKMSWIPHPSTVSTLQIRVLNVIHEYQQPQLALTTSSHFIPRSSTGRISPAVSSHS
jgi:hypothetical protein